MKQIQYFLVFLALLGQESLKAQCTTCTALTIPVDLSADPDSVWTYSGTRSGSCCGIASGQACIRFNVTVHPQATQIGFNVANPAPPGGAFYQLNCGPQTSLGTPLCVNGLTNFCITFCKNGNDSPNYTISSTRQFTVTPDQTLSTGCIGTIGVTGMQASSIQWTSIAPGAIGAYNSYLSCTSGCSDPTVTPGTNPPAYVDYRVSGTVTGCASGTVSDTIRVTFVSGVSATTAPVAPAVCFGTATTTVTATGSGGVAPYTYEWKDQNGAVIGTSAAQALTAGNFTVTVRDQLANCPGAVIPVTVIAHPSGISANAGNDRMACTSAAAITLAGSVNTATGGIWSAAGGGTFAPSASALNATFTPTAAQLAAGSATLTLTTTGNGGCIPATDQMVITYSTPPVVSAGANQIICSNASATLNGTISGGGSTGQWSSNGTGTFSPSNTALNAVYTPSAADIAAGTRTLTLTSTNGCTPVSSSMTLTISAPPVVNAGADASVCASAASQVLNGSVTGGTSTGQWSTSGTGTFSPTSTALNATYAPSAADISAGTVTLTLASTGGCSVITDSKILQINPVTVTSAGADRTICANGTTVLVGTITGSTSTGTWSTSGSGTFSPSITDLNATYTPSAADIASGNISITLTSTNSISCSNTADALSLTITPLPIVVADGPASICAGSTAQLSGSVTAGGSTGTWSGPGTFSPNANTLNAVFNPNAAAVAAGTATVTLTSTDGCAEVTDQHSITIQPQPVVSAGSDLTICEGSTASLNGSVTVGGSAGIWSTSGDGTFSSNTAPNAIYTPGSADVTAQSVTLTFTSTDGCSVNADAMIVTITPAPIVNAGADQQICQGSSASISGSITAGGSAGIWSTNGTGSFASATSLNTTYTPSSADVSAGSVTLTLSSTNGCVVRSDEQVLTIALLPIVNAGADASVCASNAVHTLNGSITAGASTGMWTTSGSGSFTPSANALNAAYTASAADISAGSVNLTLTSNNGCTPVSDNKTLQIRPVPVVTVGSDRTICEGSTVALTGTVTGSTTTGIWSTSGTGTFSPSASALNATYTPSAADIAAGSRTITLTSTNNAPCSATSASFVLTITPAPMVDAGSAQTICYGSTAQLNGSITAGGSTGTWSGNGSFSPSASTLNAIYTPSAAELSAGSATLTLTSTNGCVVRNDQVTITITPLPVANAGSDATICEGSNAVLNGSITAGGSAGNWSTSGSGTFTPNAASLSATYVPSANDIIAGNVTLTLTSTNGCSNVSDQKTITITPAPLVNAGGDQVICEGNSAVLAGSITAGGSTGSWTTSGSGSFTPSPSALNATYVPSAADANAGSVTLTLASTNGCAIRNDALLITITPLPNVNAGANATVCAASATHALNGSITEGGLQGIWSTNGTGSFTPNATALNATYNASAADITDGSIILTLTSTDGCGVVADTKILTIQAQPIANANSDQTLCANAPAAALNGSVSNGSTTGTWTTSGSGSFSPNANALNATYSPGTAEINNGSVTLTLTTTNNGVCTAHADQLTIDFTPAPIVNAGQDQIICANNAIASLSGSVSAGATTGIWSTSGTGTFSSATDLNATYTASAADISSGPITLTLTSTNYGNCVAVNDQVTISFSPAPVVNAGNDVSVCINNPATALIGTVSGGATTGTWTTTGDGTFANANALSTTYNPGPTDLANGSVLVTLTSTNFGNCIAVSDSKLISFGNGPVVLAGADQTMCANNVVQLAGSVSGSTSTGEWSTSGSGTFSPSSTDLNAIYQPSAADTTAGSVTLTLVSTNNGGCNVESDQLTIDFTPAPIVNAGQDQIICANNAIASLSGSVSAGATTGIWSTSGTGTFSSASDLNATYTASAADIANGPVTLTLTSTNFGNCVAVNDQVTISFSPAPIVNAGNDVSVCINNPATTLNGVVSGGATTGSWTTAGDGTFANANSFNTIYNPGPTDLSNGSVLVTLTSTNFGNCIAVSDSQLISFGNGPEVIAGADQTMCANNVVQLAGSVSGSTSTGGWSTSGTGTFTPSITDLNAIYQPSAADTTAGSVTITLVSTNNGGCNVESDQLTIDFTPAPIVNAGQDQIICANNAIASLSGSVSAGATTGIWSTSGTGTFSSSTDLNATYTASAADISNGPITLTLTSTNFGNCVAVNDQVTISFSPAPVVNAGNDVSVCINNPATSLIGTVSGGAATGTWTTTGDGTFANANSFNTIYNPGPNDLANGSVLVTLTSTNFGNCIAVSDSKLISFGNGPTVDAGADQTMCANNVMQLAGSVSGSTSTGEWSTSGTGTFTPSITDLNAIYQPSAADTTTGSVTLTLISTNNGGCNVEGDQLTIDFTPAPIVNAGSDQIICANNAISSLSGSVSAGATTGIWSTSGTGTFSSVTDLNAMYEPSSEDLLNGVVITLTSTENGTCVAVSDQFTISYIKEPTVSAGADQWVCVGDNAQLHGTVVNGSGTGAWSTSGTGTFSPSAAEVNTTYIPSADDLSAGGLQLVFTSTNNGNCLAVSDTLQLNFSLPPSVSVGVDQNACDNVLIDLGGSVSGSTTTGIWSTTGDGTFIPSETALNAQYHPGPTDAITGDIVLTLQATNACPMQDELVLTVIAGPSAIAGNDVTICTGQTAVDLFGEVGGTATTGQWSTLGDGNFAPSVNDLNAIYQLGTTDLAAGEAILILTTLDDGVCSASHDTLMVLVNNVPEVIAGTDTTICSTNALVLNGSVSNGGGLWTSNGTGSFLPDANSIDAEYHFSEEDKQAGSVLLTLSATASCSPVADTIEVTLIAPPIVDAGTDQSICANAVIDLDGSITSGTGTGIWSTVGTGTFTDDPEVLQNVYQPSVDDVANGSVTLTLTSTGDVHCASVTEQITINFNNGFTIEAGEDQLICNASQTDLAATITGDASITWIGAGQFTSITDLQTQYTATPEEITAGTATIILIGEENNGCGISSDTLFVNFGASASVDAGPSIGLCAGSTLVQLNGSVSGSSSTGIWTTSGDGQFLPDATTLDAIYELGAMDQINGVQLTLTSTNEGECGPTSADVLITINAGISVEAGEDVSACLDTPGITLSGLVSGATTMGVWSTAGDGEFNENAVEINAVYLPGPGDIQTGSTWVYLTSTNNNGCEGAIDSLLISLLPMPEMIAGEDVTICPNSSIELVGTASNTTTAFWFSLGGGSLSNDTSIVASYQSVAADAGRTITLIVQGWNGCGLVEDTLLVTVMDTLAMDVSYTAECGSTEVVFTNNTIGAEDLTWSFGDGATSQEAGPIHTYAASGNYEVIILATDQNGCEASDTLSVIVPAVPIASFSADPLEVELYFPIDLASTSTNAVAWDWNMGDGTTDVSGEIVQHVYNELGTYQIELVVTSASGCTDTAMVSVIVIEPDQPIVLPTGIPTAFTPNGDGANDVFLVRGGPFAEFQFNIYDNWGVQLFSSDQQAIGWDGSYRGKEQPGGVYIYTFKGRTIDGKEVDMAGDISIIR